MSGFVVRLAAATVLAVSASAAQAAEGAPGDGFDTATAPSDPHASSEASAQATALHLQSTFVVQFHPAFTSPYRGPQSLDPAARADETWDATVSAGVRLWKGMELWAVPQLEQGFGLSDTHGIAGFPSGMAAKVGSTNPYTRLQSLFLRQEIDLGGERGAIDPDLQQLGGTQTADRLVITLGKFSVADMFDGNTYAHDARTDFLNWTLTDTGTFDFAGDAWGYTPGLAVELYEGAWVFRQGLFDLTSEPAGTRYDATFTQFQIIEEIERDYSLFGQPGAVRVLGFLTRARMARFSDAIAYGEATGQTAQLAPVRRYQSRGGVSFNLEQQVSDQLGVFVRAGWAEGGKEPYEFTDVDRTGAVGLSLQGARWDRPDDVVGAAVVVNAISSIHQAFFNDGGLGIVIGDGKLPHPGPEAIFETFYSVLVTKPVWFTFDYQFVGNPAYNRDRGPVNLLGARLHTEF